MLPLTVLRRFEFEKEIEKLEKANRLDQVVAQFTGIDLHRRWTTSPWDWSSGT